MTAPGAPREVEQVTVAYQAAIARISAETTADAIQLWQTVPPTQPAARTSLWLSRIIAAVLGHRAEAAALGRSYYRLVRALQTGRTIDDPERHDDDTSATTTLGDLRDEFYALVPGTSGTGTPGDRTSPSMPPRVHSGDATSVGIDHLKGLDDFDEQNLAQSQAELRAVLTALGPNNLQAKVSKIDTSKPATEVDALRDTAHAEAGRRQAAAAARVAMNGARSSNWAMTDADKQALGWARISTTGTPCGWCAMLISRGAVYKSSRTASVDYDDGDQYHDNCHCIAVPVFSDDYYETSPIFDLNRKYSELWPRVTAGHGGTEALSVWRKYFREEQAA